LTGPGTSRRGPVGCTAPLSLAALIYRLMPRPGANPASCPRRSGGGHWQQGRGRPLVGPSSGPWGLDWPPSCLPASFPWWPTPSCPATNDFQLWELLEGITLTLRKVTEKLLCASRLYLSRSSEAAAAHPERNCYSIPVILISCLRVTNPVRGCALRPPIRRSDARTSMSAPPGRAQIEN
jgi:hypothetical protein